MSELHPSRYFYSAATDTYETPPHRTSTHLLKLPLHPNANQPTDQSAKALHKNQPNTMVLAESKNKVGLGRALMNSRSGSAHKTNNKHRGNGAGRGGRGASSGQSEMVRMIV